MSKRGIIMKKKSENLENNIKGKEISEAIEKYAKKASNVFIIGHKRPDYDSIGSAAGLLSMVEQLGKKAYIIVGDDIEDIDGDIKKIMFDLGSRLNVISLERYKELKNDDSLLIMTDVNKRQRIFLKDDLDDFKNIIIVDHHDIKEGETVEDTIELIYPSASSACELVAQTMLYKENKDSKSKYKIPKDIATLLYSGIELDTERFKSKTTNITHAVADKLLEYGADKDYINRLFRNDRATYNTIANLIVNGTILRQYSKDFTELGISFNLNREFPSTIYKPEELAKAADLQVEFKDTDAAFAMGYIKTGLVGISARSSSDYINVGKIMEGMQGGGNATSAGTQIFSDDIECIEDKLIHVVEDFLSLQETPVINLEPDLTEQPQKFKKIVKKRRKKD